MSQGFVIGYPRFRATDANGLPISGALVYFFESGTTTPSATYSDAALTAANPHPVECDSSGEAWIFVPDGTLYTVALHDADDVQLWSKDGIEATTSPAPAPAPPAPVPTGGIIAYGGSAAPTGFLLCDGSAVSRATYTDLFTAIGTTFGTGDGSSTFNVPDLRQRFPLGKAASGTGATLGETGGAIDHTHTGPSHTHDTTVPRDGWGHSLNNPSTSGRIRTGDASGTGTEANAEQATADQTVTSAAGGTGNTGTANPAYLAVNFLIKT